MEELVSETIDYSSQLELIEELLISIDSSLLSISSNLSLFISYFLYIICFLASCYVVYLILKPIWLMCLR